MVYVKIYNEEVWERFFTPAGKGSDYLALVHCKFEASCRSNIMAQHIFDIIPSVETRYCFDLVNGMNALIQAALSRSGAGHPNDKFVFISDSTLPVKPFAFIHQRLTTNRASDFCVFPRNEWAEISNPVTGIHQVQVQVAVKHHQWIVLSREHAGKAISKQGEMRDLMQTFRMNLNGRNSGCLDEFWHFAVIFGSLNLTTTPEEFALPGFGGAVLHSAEYQSQGQCNTFVHWFPAADGSANNITELARVLENDVGTEISPTSEKHPASIRRLSLGSLTALSASWFLFVRKVEDGSLFAGCDNLPDAFDALIFSNPPRAIPSLAQPFVGQGNWLDNRHSVVSISASNGAIQLRGSDLMAHGGYCGPRIDVVFSNGYRATAVLSEDGRYLQWDNAVVWNRADVR